MPNLYRQGIKVVGNRDKSIITPDTTPPVAGDWRERIEGVGEESMWIREKFDGTIWVLKESLS